MHKIVIRIFLFIVPVLIAFRSPGQAFSDPGFNSNGWTNDWYINANDAAVDNPLTVTMLKDNNPLNRALKFKVNGLGADYITIDGLNSGNGSNPAKRGINIKPGFHGTDDFHAYISNVYCIYRHDFTFLQGHTYRGGIWLKSPDNITVEVMFRRSDAHYDACAVKRISVGPEWQYVQITGGFEDEVAGFMGINFLSTGTLYMDDVSISDITILVNNKVPASAEPVPSSLFGIHINSLGSHNVWPDINAGTFRIWMSGTEWSKIQPSANVWDFTRLDYFVTHRDNNAPGANIIYTFGGSPAWTSINGKENATPHIEDWRIFLENIGNRYSSPQNPRILYYEMWNETNQGHWSDDHRYLFWHGSVADMVAMTREANIILKGINPDVKILSPNVTIYGYQWLEEFLALGGGQYVDIISYHDYQGKKPELSIPKIEAFKDIMITRGLQNLPLWNTEGNLGRSADDKSPEVPLTDDDAMAAVSRAYIIQWLYGVTNFNLYAYEGDVMGTNYARLSKWVNVLPPYVDVTACAQFVPTSTDKLIPLPASIAYRETASWLTGASVTSKSTANNSWKVEITRENGYKAWILWNTEGTTSYTVPAQWTVVAKRDLDGCTSNEDNQVTIGTKPILLELVPNNTLQQSARVKSSQETQEPQPESETLMRNYPNPFSDATTVYYQLGKDANVNLSVYDLYGRKISELVNSRQSQGAHEVTFSAGDLPKGVYLCQLKTERTCLVSKILIN